MKFNDFATEVIWALKNVEFMVLDREFDQEDLVELLLEELIDDDYEDWEDQIDNFMHKLMTDPDFEVKMLEESEEW